MEYTLNCLLFYVHLLKLIFRKVTFGMTSATQYYYSTVLRSLFKGGKEVTNVEEFWNVRVFFPFFIISMRI